MVFSIRKKVLTVTLHFDDSHTVLRRKNKLPQGMGAAFLAGAFSRKTCDIKVYSELYSGPLEDEKLLSWPDMIVLTGVTNCFDRMLHITAYARTKNSKVIVVVGGPAIRALPEYSCRFFDYCCTGDIEQLQDVVRDAFGRHYVAEEMIPRLDLAHWIGMHGHVETSRYCNFNCGFCSVAGEKMQYRKYDLGYIEKQFELMGKRRTVHFIDNNFYGNDRDYFLERLGLIDKYREKGHFKYWSALVTGDFFINEDNLSQAARTGCGALFTGVESFSADALKRYKKHQNTILPQEEMIRKTLKNGIAFWYGLFMDVYQRSIEEITQELEFIVTNPGISLPGFITIPIPLLGTEYFHQCLADRLFFPNTRLRHLDGTTLCMEPLSPINDVVTLIRNMRQLAGYRRNACTHAFGFYRNYHRYMKKEIMFYALASNILLALNTIFTAGSLFPKTTMMQRSYISTTEKLEKSYTPAFRIDSRYSSYFEPTMLTDENGMINEELADDIFKKQQKTDLEVYA